MSTSTIPSLHSVRAMFAALVPSRERTGCGFVWLNNFEAERFWLSPGAVQLPKLSQPTDVAFVNCLEEFGLFLSDSRDMLILRRPSSEQFLDYVRRLGFDPPKILTLSSPDRTTPIAQSVLADEPLRRRLSALAEQGRWFLLPYAKTRLEEEIGIQLGLGLLGPTAEVCARTNSKIYSRTISRDLGLRVVPGCECESLSELASAAAKLATMLPGNSKVVLKEDMGVSGKGLFVADNQAKLDQIISLLRRKAKPDSHVAFVMEAWLDKLMDINYQIFVAPDGDVHLLGFRQILTANGVHLGHRFPPAFTPAQRTSYEEAAEAIGRRLFRDGFTGIAGIDSIIGLDGEVFPVLEINARFNMSTYQLGFMRLIGPEAKMLAKHYALMLNEPLPFDKLAARIGSDMFDPESNPSGLLIQNFATVNANYDPDSRVAFKGQLYVLLVGRTFEQLDEIDRRVSTKLAGLAGERSDSKNPGEGRSH